MVLVEVAVYVDRFVVGTPVHSESGPEPTVYSPFSTSKTLQTLPLHLPLRTHSDLPEKYPAHS